MSNWSSPSSTCSPARPAPAPEQGGASVSPGGQGGAGVSPGGQGGAGVSPGGAGVSPASVAGGAGVSPARYYPTRNPRGHTRLLLAAVLALGGCKQGWFETQLDAGVKAIFEPRKTPQQYLLIAVSSDDADARREAVIQISRSKQHDREWAIKGLVAIALLENEPQTRCVALRALARSTDPRAVDTALRIINYTEYPPEEVYPPVPVVRWDATALLADFALAGTVPEAQHEQVYATLLKQLKMDSERHARMAAARGLGAYPQAETLTALIEGLRDEDFAVAYACESTLVHLTGVSHGANALAWQAWYDEHGNEAFAQAGNVPPSRQPPYEGMVGKLMYDTRDLVDFLWPPSRDE
jgi:hypothetical protein